MAIEKSPYEGVLDQKLAGQNCLGTIVSVDADARTCRVKTFGLKGRTDDLDLSDVQWVSLSASTTGDGAEDTAIPVVGQMAVITFINNQPYIQGYYRPVKTPNDPGSVNKEQDPNQSEEIRVNTGDRILKTLAGNKVLMRSGGSVEIESNRLCRTHWLPANRTVNTVCGTHKLEADGGFVHWTLDTETNATTYQFFVRDALKDPDTGLDVQIGTPGDDTQFITMALGKIAPDTYEIPEPAFNLTVDPNGNTEIQIGLKQQVKLSINSDTGDITLETSGNVTQKVTGNVTQEIEGDISQTVKGNVTETVEGTITDTAKKAVSFSTDDALEVSAKGDADLSSDANLTLSGGGDATLSADGSAEVSAKGSASLSANGSATISGKAGTNLGSASSMTNVNGAIVNLGGGGLPVALVGSQVVGVGNLGIPVVSVIVQGSSRVTATL